MQVKIRFAIAHKEYSGTYINKSADGLTTDLDRIMNWYVMDDAVWWLENSMYSPVDKECYKIARIEVTKRDLEVEPNV
jgi:hypothetical protein